MGFSIEEPRSTGKMVISTLKKFSAAASGKVPDYGGRYNLKTYGYPVKHVKHHFCLAPLHFCTVLGSLVAGAYIIRMLYIRDCILFSWMDFKPIKQNQNITLFNAEVNYKNRPAEIAPVKLD